MQRRATALWAVLLIVLSVGAYAFIGVAEEPALVENPDHTLSDGATVQFDGQEYTFSAGDSALTFFNESARETESFEDGADFEYQNESHAVSIPNETDPSSFTLRRALPDDVETTTVNDTEYVVVQEDGEQRLVEPDQYLQERFGDEAFIEFAEGDEIEYDGNPSTVMDVAQDEFTLVWDAPQNESMEFEEGERVTLGGTEYVAHYPDEETLVLSSNVDEYETQSDLHESFRERINGLWAIVIIGGLSAITLMGLAYMPSRY